MSVVKFLTKDQQTIEVDVKFLKTSKLLSNALQEYRAAELGKKCEACKEIHEIVAENVDVVCQAGMYLTAEKFQIETKINDQYTKRREMLVKAIDEDGAVFIHLPAVEHGNLKHIIDWWQAGTNQAELKLVLKNFANLSDDILWQLIEAAHLLDIRPLLEIISSLLMKALAKRTMHAFSKLIEKFPLDDEDFQFSKLIQFYKENYSLVESIE